MSLSIRLSHFLADLFVAKGWIEEDGKIAYVVGLDVIFSTLIDWLVVGTLAILRARLWAGEPGYFSSEKYSNQKILVSARCSYRSSTA